MAIDRKNLFLFNREKVEEAYHDAVRDGFEDPVVGVFDMEDSAGRHIAEAVVGKEAVEEQFKIVPDGSSPTLIYAVSREAAIDSYGHISDQGRKLLNEGQPEGNYLCLVVGNGGVSWTVQPFG